MTNKIREDERVDIVFRFVEKYPDIETVQEHQAVLLEKGGVWLGKVGKGLSEKTIATINKQCKDGPTYLYLARLIGGEYKIDRARLLEVSKDLPSKDAKLVPAYYREHNVTPFVVVWFKLDQIETVDGNEVCKMKVKSSGLKLFDTMKGSPASLFFLTQKQKV